MHFDPDDKAPEMRQEEEETETMLVAEKPRIPLWEQPRVQLITLAIVGVIVIAWRMSGNSDDTPKISAQFATLSESPTPPVTTTLSGDKGTISALPDKDGSAGQVRAEQTQAEQSDPFADQVSHALNVQQIYSQKTREGVVKLSERLTAVEQRMAALQKQLDAIPPPVVALPASVSSPPVQKTATVKPKNNQNRNSIHSAHINSVYPGLAWVTWQGSSWALRPGDSFAGSTILQIDEKTRTVITSAGTIR